MSRTARRMLIAALATPLMLCACVILGLIYTGTPRAVPEPPAGSLHEQYDQNAASSGYSDFNQYLVALPIEAVEQYYAALLPRYCPAVPDRFTAEGVTRRISCELPPRLLHSQSFSVSLEPVSASQTRIGTTNSWDAP